MTCLIFYENQITIKFKKQSLSIIQRTQRNKYIIPSFECLNKIYRDVIYSENRKHG